MTKKHYEAIARVFRRNTDLPAAAGAAVRETARELADVLQADNPRFDRDRFLTACGL